MLLAAANCFAQELLKIENIAQRGLEGVIGEHQLRELLEGRGSRGGRRPCVNPVGSCESDRAAIR